MNNTDDRLLDLITKEENIFLAYLRVKNDFSNSELRLYQEYQYFELNLKEQINDIKDLLYEIIDGCYSTKNYNTFDFIVKIKKFDEKEIKYRPITKYPLNLLVLMQSVFNVIFNELKNFLPDENIGVQLNDENSPYLYKKWTEQYGLFVKKQFDCLDSKSPYQYCYEYDIAAFFPSISQNKLVKKLLDDLSLEKNSKVARLIKFCIYYYKSENVSVATKKVFTNYIKENTKEKADLGLPQGPLFSPFLASYYTNDMYKVIKKKIHENYKVDCEYFTYVDDGRIFFREKVNEEDIKKYIDEYLHDLNDSDCNKTIELNEDKSYLISLDENSASSRLKVLENQVSMLNSSIDPNFSILDDTYIVYKEKYEAVIDSINKEEHIFSSNTNEVKKINKKRNTIKKRKASSWSRILTKNNNFYETIDSIFSFEKDKPVFEIENLNFSYVLQNLVEKIENIQQIKHLLNAIKKYLEYYSKYIKNDDSMIYYYTIAYFQLLKIDKRLLSYKLLENQLPLQINSFSYPFVFFSKKLDRFEELIKSSKTNAYHVDKDNYAIESTLYFFECHSKIDLHYLYQMIFRKEYPVDKKINSRDEAIEKIVNIWKTDYNNKGYITPEYIIFDNLYIDDSDNKMKIFNDSVFPVEYIELLTKTNYVYLFKKFFMDFFELESSIIIDKHNNAIVFWKYRIISYLEYKKFNLEYFFNLLTDCIKNKEYQCQAIDFNFEKVREILAKNLNSSQIDIILQLHYYLTFKWKNGSKDLPFYTLHNQEHSLELLISYQKLKSIIITNKLNLTKNECFLLFAACYLHDIGMLSGVKENDKFDLSNKKVLDYYAKINDILNTSHKTKSTYSLDKAYQIHKLTEDFYEDKVRSEHAKISQILINHSSEIPLTDLEKQLVGKISFNHTYDSSKFYGTENYEYYKKRKIDIRKISIWLRLLDLTDVSKNRVSQEAFGTYFDRMSLLSRLHWIKHLACDGIDYKIEFEPPKKNKLIGDTKVTIKIIMNYLPKKEKLNCNVSYNCKRYVQIPKADETVFKPEKHCEYNKCNLLCKFLNENIYFEEEIHYLNEYLDTLDGHLNIEFNISLNETTKRDDFKISSNNNQTATKNIRKKYLHHD